MDSDEQRLAGLAALRQVLSNTGTASSSRLAAQATRDRFCLKAAQVL